jgi:hypothetical protein
VKWEDINEIINCEDYKWSDEEKQLLIKKWRKWWIIWRFEEEYGLFKKWTRYNESWWSEVLSEVGIWKCVVGCGGSKITIGNWWFEFTEKDS